MGDSAGSIRAAVRLKMKQQTRQRLPAGQTAQAEQLAVQALAFLADDPEELSRFVALTGIDASQIRAAAGQPGFLAGVLEYMCAHEPLLLSFAEAVGHKPQQIERALEGIAGPRWSRDVP
jgi:hypothetical protein